MAIFRRSYRAYDGRLTPRRWRFSIPARYALMDLVRSRALLGILVIACVPPLVETSVIYLVHNPAARMLLGLMKLTELVRIDTGFFIQALSTQCFFGFILAAWLAPTLVGGDLAHGALPLYLSRPFSRFEYVLGKAAVVIGVGSAVTWLPVLALYVVNGVLASDGWWYLHLRTALGIVLGGLLWCLLVSLFTLSLSAWIKWRLLASSILVGTYLVAAGFGEALVTALHVPWGRLLNLGHAFRMIWTGLAGAAPFEREVPLVAAWTVVALVLALSVTVLNRRLRAREVVR